MQAQRGRRKVVENVLVPHHQWRDKSESIFHSLASHQKSCPRQPSDFLRKQPQCWPCLMRPFLAEYPSEWQSTVSNKANKCLITSLSTQAHISSCNWASLLHELEDMFPPVTTSSSLRVVFPLCNPAWEPFQLAKMCSCSTPLPWHCAVDVHTCHTAGAAGMVFMWWPCGDCRGSSERGLGKMSCRKQDI